MSDTVHTRLPDMRTELERFNAERESFLGGMPITPDNRMPLARTWVGGDWPIPGEDGEKPQ